MRRQDQRGFALLAIFLMSATIALMLYAQLPRLAFENEREKEQLLIDRGEQFVLAIRRFTKDYGRFPATLKELEETNRKRYIRRIYTDPYTGKDEWRLIHSNGSQLTDSLVEKAPLADGTTGSSSPANSQQNQQQQVNAAVLQRSSDQTLPGNQTFFQNPGQNPAQPPGFPPGVPVPNGVQIGNPQLAQQFPDQQFPGQPFAGQPGIAPLPGAAGQPVNLFPGQPPAQQQGKAAGPQFQPQFPGQQFIGQQFAGQPPPPGFQIGPNGQLIPEAPGTPNFGAQPFSNQQPGPSQPGQLGLGTAGQVFGGQPGQQPQNTNTPGGAALPPSNPNAAGIINQLLTGAGGGSSGFSSAFAAANSAVAGIAGVASLHKGPTIKVYNERTKYEEWEFVYRPAAPLTGAAPAGNTGAAPGGNTGTPNPNTPLPRNDGKGLNNDPMSRQGPPPPPPPNSPFPNPGRGGQIPIQLGAPLGGRR